MCSADVADDVAHSLESLASHGAVHRKSGEEALLHADLLLLKSG
jgi:hypothetical protein